VKIRKSLDGVVCNDYNACTEDSCDDATGCVYTDISSQCQTENKCHIDYCDPVIGCTYNDVACFVDDWLLIIVIPMSLHCCRLWWLLMPATDLCCTETGCYYEDVDWLMMIISVL